MNLRRGRHSIIMEAPPKVSMPYVPNGQTVTHGAYGGASDDAIAVPFGGSVLRVEKRTEVGRRILAIGERMSTKQYWPSAVINVVLRDVKSGATSRIGMDMLRPMDEVDAEVDAAAEVDGGIGRLIPLKDTASLIAHVVGADATLSKHVHADETVRYPGAFTATNRLVASDLFGLIGNELRRYFVDPNIVSQPPVMAHLLCCIEYLVKFVLDRLRLSSWEASEAAAAVAAEIGALLQ
jgi:hypothetical protein